MQWRCRCLSNIVDNFFLLSIQRIWYSANDSVLQCINVHVTASDNNEALTLYYRIGARSIQITVMLYEKVPKISDVNV